MSKEEVKVAIKRGAGFVRVSLDLFVALRDDKMLELNTLTKIRVDGLGERLSDHAGFVDVSELGDVEEVYILRRTGYRTVGDDRGLAVAGFRYNEEKGGEVWVFYDSAKTEKVQLITQCRTREDGYRLLQLRGGEGGNKAYAVYTWFDLFGTQTTRLRTYEDVTVAIIEKPAPKVRQEWPAITSRGKSESIVMKREPLREEERYFIVYPPCPKSIEGFLCDRKGGSKIVVFLSGNHGDQKVEMITQCDIKLAQLLCDTRRAQGGIYEMIDVFNLFVGARGGRLMHHRQKVTNDPFLVGKGDNLEALLLF